MMLNSALPNVQPDNNMTTEIKLTNPPSMQGMMDKMRALGFTPTLASWEDAEHIYVFSRECHGPAMYGHPDATLHYSKLSRWYSFTCDGLSKELVLNILNEGGKMNLHPFYQNHARRLNERFKPETILRHEARWMKAVQKRKNDWGGSMRDPEPSKVHPLIAGIIHAHTGMLSRDEEWFLMRTIAKNLKNSI